MRTHTHITMAHVTTTTTTTSQNRVTSGMERPRCSVASRWDLQWLISWPYSPHCWPFSQAVSPPQKPRPPQAYMTLAIWGDGGDSLLSV